VDYTRRDFLNTIISSTLTVGGSTLLSSGVRSLVDSSSSADDEYAIFENEATVLFQGDSITDWGRDKSDSNPNSGLGHGYAFFASAHLRHRLPRHNVQCYNRGVGGDKVFQLADRWDKDCIQLKPDLLSILIGVNDFWHTVDGNYDGSVKEYKRDYMALLERTKKELPNVELVIGEPFVIKEGSSVDDSWFPDFYDYQSTAKEVALKYDAAFILYQSLFDKAAQNVRPTYWSQDGVHPTMAGFQLMAEAWLQTVKRMDSS